MNSSEGRLHSCPPRAAPVLHPAAFSLPPAAWPDPDHYTLTWCQPREPSDSPVSRLPALSLQCSSLLHLAAIPVWPFRDAHHSISRRSPFTELSPASLLLIFCILGPTRLKRQLGRLPSVCPLWRWGNHPVLPHSKEVIRSPDTSHPHVCPDKGPSCTGGPQQEQPLCAAPATLCAPVTSPLAHM